MPLETPPLDKPPFVSVSESDNGKLDAPPGSLLAELRARRDDIAQERTVDLEVPGYGGELFLTCKPIAFATLRRIATKLEKSNSDVKELNAAADTLIEATEAIKARTDKGLESIDPNGNMVRFEQRLGELLGFEAASARETVFELFRNDMAILTVCARFNEWLADATTEIDEDFREPSRPDVK